MKKHIFVAPTELTYKPNCDRPEPEHIDMHIFGHDTDASIQDTIDDLIELNQEGADESGSPFSVRIEHHRRREPWRRGKGNRLGTAG